MRSHGGHRGHDHMVVGFITTYAISAYKKPALLNLGNIINSCITTNEKYCKIK
jgi:hypothetical protein